ncbi:hypothetical protein TruAng_002445 [Truncatella angustata]|nr:hypothetical protein TruAng_002445 [Truncatella angustata]
MPYSSRQAYRGSSRGHRWTKFELDIVLSLICKLEHLTSLPLTFTTKLNEALNGTGNHIAYDDDIPVDDVRALLTHIEKEKKGPLAFIERQPAPHRITRMKKRVFERNISFTGSQTEWIAGRRDEVAAKKQQDLRAGSQMTFINSQGVQIERWVPGSEPQPGAWPTQTDTWASHDILRGTAGLPLGWDNQGSVGMTPAWGYPGSVGMTPTWGNLGGMGATPAWNHQGDSGGTPTWNRQASTSETPGWTIEGNGGATPAYGQLPPPGLIFPPVTPRSGGWGAPPSLIVGMTNQNTSANVIPWHTAERLDTQNDASTADPVVFDHESRWAKEATETHRATAAENQPLWDAQYSVQEREL